MSKDTLISFILKKGNDRKTALYDQMIFQTQDSEFSDRFVGLYHVKVDEKRDKLFEIEHGTN